MRDVDACTVRVYFDDMTEPVLQAEDTTIEWSRIGFGSFDDTGRFRRPVITGAQSRSVDPAGSPFTAGWSD